MKLNKYFLVGFCIPFLLGCTAKRKYDGTKIKLAYVENGTLVTTNADEMYTRTVTNKESNIFVLGFDNCGSCTNAKGILKDYSEANHCNTYYINVKDIAKDDLTKIQKATSGDYMFGEKDSVPAVYFMFQGDVAFRCGEDELKDRLTTYVEVEQPSSVN